jgi:hypothetical protein
MIGGSALAVQLHHRLSEDLDFCIWKKHKDDKVDLEWKTIEKQLSSVAGMVKTNVLAMNHIDFMADGVKVTFFGNTRLKQPPSLQKINLLNNIRIADRESIGVMKLEVLLHRRAFRDYYDLYALLREGVPLKVLIEKTKVFSRHQIRTRDILLILTNGKYFEKDAGFDRLSPKYNVTASDIELFMIDRIREMQEKDKELPCKASDKLSAICKEVKLNKKLSDQKGRYIKNKHQ